MPTELTDRLGLPAWLVANGLTREGVEVGVLFGEYSNHLLSFWPGVLHMVDPWVNQSPEHYLDGCNSVRMDLAFQRASAVAARHAGRARIRRGFSLELAPTFADGSLDFVYLDGNHAYAWVKADIAAWWPKVRPGGLLGGHDYYERHDEWQECGVEQAVREFGAEGRTVHRTPSCTSWWVRKELA